jgi:hypothetical protein
MRNNPLKPDSNKGTSAFLQRNGVLLQANGRKLSVNGRKLKLNGRKPSVSERKPLSKFEDVALTTSYLLIDKKEAIHMKMDSF